MGKITLQQLHQNNSHGLHLLQGRDWWLWEGALALFSAGTEERKWDLSPANWLKTEPKKHFLFVPGLFNVVSTSAPEY